MPNHSGLQGQESALPGGDPDPMISEIHRLLAEYQQMADRHQATLAPYRDADGGVIEELYGEYGDARITTAIEASDWLYTLTRRLAALAGPPPRRTFTVAVGDLSRHDGERPSCFAVYATDFDDARRTLVQLPTFRRWCQDATPDDSPDAAPDIEFVAEHSHPGLPAPGTYTDLRPEQSAQATSKAAVPNSRIGRAAGRPATQRTTPGRH